MIVQPGSPGEADICQLCAEKQRIIIDGCFRGDPESIAAMRAIGVPVSDDGLTWGVPSPCS